jgi:hypothetical protein
VVILMNFFRKKRLKKIAFLASNVEQEHGLASHFSSPAEAEDYFFDQAKSSTQILIKIAEIYLNGMDSLEKVILEINKENLSKSAAQRIQILGPKKLDQTIQDFEKYKIIENNYHLWYNNHVQMVDEVLGLANDQRAKQLFASLLASTSVSNAPIRNIKMTMEFLQKFIESGSYENFDTKFMAALKARAPEEIRYNDKKRLEYKINELNRAGFGSSVFKPGRPFLGHMYGASVNPNVLKSFRGEEISGPKVDPFSRNLMGDEEAITVDIHVARYLLGKESPTNKKDYIEAKDLVKEIAGKIGISNAQAQAAVWCANLILTGEPIETYETIIINKKEKLKELILQAREIIS